MSVISPTTDEEAFVRCVLDRGLYRKGGGFTWSVAPRCELEDAGYVLVEAEAEGRGRQCSSLHEDRSRSTPPMLREACALRTAVGSPRDYASRL